MLIKTINLNLRIIQNHIAATAFVLILGFFLMLMFIGIFMLPIWLIIILIVTVKGYCKLFCNSIYQEEAGLYLTLPISNEINMWGKVFACVLWSILLGVISFIAIAIMSASTGTGITALMEQLSGELLDKGMSATQIGIIMGLTPISMVISTSGMCFSIMTVQTMVGKNKNKGHIVLRGMAINAMVVTAVSGLVNLGVSKGLDYFYTQIAVYVLYIVLIVVMHNYCKHHIDEGFDIA